MSDKDPVVERLREAYLYLRKTVPKGSVLTAENLEEEQPTLFYLDGVRINVDEADNEK